MKEILIGKDNSGGRLDKMIFKYLDKAPQSFVYKMLRKKNITLNGGRACGKEFLKTGDVIRLYLADETIDKFRSKAVDTPSSYSLKPYICYEDENIIAMNKPFGMLTQKANANDICLNDLLSGYLSDDDGLFTPGVSNRLDRNTTGLVLAGKTLRASRELNRAIRERLIGKYYLCVVKGVIEKAEKIHDRLIKDNDSNIVRICGLSEDIDEAEEIITEYRPLADNGEATLLEVKLITGKSHQIRAHLAYKGFPVAGDRKYGDKSFNTGLRKKYDIRGQLLHAARVRFSGLSEGLEYLNGKDVFAPLPYELEKFIVKEGLNDNGGCNGYLEQQRA